MSTLLKPIIVQQILLDKRISIFSNFQFKQMFHVSDYQTKHFLETYTRENLFIRLKRGLYCLRQVHPEEKTIANTIYTPSYISFEYALAYYNIIPEAVFTVTSATTKPTREFSVLGKSYLYHTIKRSAFTGYSAQLTNQRTVFMADREKGLVDYLYFVSIHKKTLNNRLNLTGIDKDKINKYAKLYNNTALHTIISQISL